MNYKEQAARQALAYVHSGMALGLGTGSTAGYFVDLLAERLATGALHGIVGVPTSERTAERARAGGIPLTTLDELVGARGLPCLDLVVDGADEVDGELNLIKGLGRALLREKIVEIHTGCLVVVGDQSKQVERLGRGPLPVEIVPFGAEAHVRWLNTLGCRSELWLADDGSPLVTDGGHYLARCWFTGGIDDAHALAHRLAVRPGIVEHGLFLNMASRAVIAGPDGVRVLERSR